MIHTRSEKILKHKFKLSLFFLPLKNYDILPTEEEHANWSRFTYQYKNKKSIVNGLKELYDCVKFITSDKPTKRQKRNDYED